MDVELYSSFEDWASDLGYDAESRKAYRTYRRCIKMVPRVRKFLGDDALIRQLRAAEH